jgi:hypothetical protein
LNRFVFSIALLACCVASAPAAFVTINQDDPGEGFNDPTPAVPVGGNAGTSVGMQRLLAFEFAASIWDQILQPSVPVQVSASFDALPCQPTSGVLGSAGPLTVALNFVGAPRVNTWYVAALANQYAGLDLIPARSDISATFQSELGTPECLPTLRWYYGLDNLAGPGEVDLVITLLHELAHGLGFLSLVDEETGSLMLGQIDIYSTFLFDRSSGKSWEFMSDAERTASAINSGNLVWTGARVQSAAVALSAGLDSEGRVQVFAPDPVRLGSSISHWTPAAAPNQLMEPFMNRDVPQTPTLTRSLLEDIGWATPNSTPVAGIAAMDARRDGDAVYFDFDSYGLRSASLYRDRRGRHENAIDHVELSDGTRAQLRDTQPPRGVVEYWLELSLESGLKEWQGPIPIAAAAVPAVPVLRMLGPNPAVGEVAFTAYIPRPMPARVDVFDVRGRRVRALSTGAQAEGWHPFLWDGRGAKSQRMPRGVYFLTLQTPQHRTSLRFALDR